MGRYAAETGVSTEKSRAEIERTLRKYGASHFAYITRPKDAQIAFRLQGRSVRFALPLPDPDDPRFSLTPGKRRHRSLEDRARAWEQGCRQAWRALALCIKAKLEAVESGISHFEDEFLAWIVMPDGKTVADHVRPRIDSAYKGHAVPLLSHYTE